MNYAPITKPLRRSKQAARYPPPHSGLGLLAKRNFQQLCRYLRHWIPSLLGLAAFLIAVPLNVSSQEDCHCDDPNAIVIGSSGVTTNITTAISLGLLEPMPDAATTPQQVCIKGKLKVNASYTFYNSELSMDTDASIEVNGSFAGLTIKNSSVYGCDEMWNGIKVSSFNVLVLTGSTIADAKTGVLALENTTLKIGANNTFRNNYVGLDLTGPLQISTLNGCTFETNGVGPLGYIGIKLTNMSSFSVGTPNPWVSPNNFKDLASGIVAANSSFSVYGAIFDIYGTSLPINPVFGYDGDAIFLENNCNLTATKNRFYNCSAGIFAVNSSMAVTRNHFEGYINDTEYKKIGIGIVAFYPDNDVVRVSNNYIDAVRGGIFVHQATNNSTVLIQNDTIFAGDPLYDSFGVGYGGVFINGGQFQPGNPAIIEDNLIELSNSPIGGVELWDCSNVRVINNWVTLIPDEDVFWSVRGISLIGSTSNHLISGNQVFGSDIIPGISTYSRGFLHSNSGGAIYCCNTVRGVHDGMVIEGYCSLTDFYWMNFALSYDADLRYRPTGFTGPIGSLTSNPDNRWWQEDGVAVHEGNTEDFIFMSRHFTKPFYAPTLPPIIEMPNAPNASWFVQGNEDESENCPSALDCDFGMLTGEVNETDRIIAEQDWDSKTVFQPTLKWRAERGLLGKLEEEPDLIDDDSLVQVFYGDFQDSILAVFNEIEREIELLDTVAAGKTAYYRSNIDSIFNKLLEIIVLDSILVEDDSLGNPTVEAEKSALVDEVAELMLENDTLFAIILSERISAAQAIIAQNDSITTTRIFEENEKTVNDIWLRTVVSGIDTLTNNQIDLLEDIVWQCPLMGGNAVYRARVLYQMAVDSLIYYNDDDSCAVLEDRSAFRKTPDVEQTFRLYPNPANQSVTLALDKNFNTPASLLITNIYGEPVFQSKVPAGQIQFTFPVHDIPTGFYFCRVFRDEKEAFSQKLLIVH